jgi:hypothetical protein
MDKEVLALTTSLASSIFSPEASAEARVGTCMDSKIASKTLPILLFLGVAIVVVDSFGSPATSEVLNTFGCYAVFFVPGSSTGFTLASVGMAGADSVATEIASAL